MSDQTNMHDDDDIEIFSEQTPEDAPDYTGEEALHENQTAGEEESTDRIFLTPLEISENSITRYVNISSEDTAPIKVTSSPDIVESDLQPDALPSEGNPAPLKGSQDQDIENGITWFGELEDYSAIPVLIGDAHTDLPVSEQPGIEEIVPQETKLKFVQGLTHADDLHEEISDRTPLKVIENLPSVPADDIPTQPPPKPLPIYEPDRDKNIPHPVSQVDWQATKLAPSAYSARPTSHVPPAVKTSDKAPTLSKKPQTGGTKPVTVKQKTKKRKKPGCFLKVFLILLFLGIFIGACIGSIGIYQYFRIASSLPNVEELKARSSQFETTRILDRNGNILYEIIDPNAGKRTYIPLDEISPYLIAATIATEDKEFYNHPGFDLVALLRALYQNYTAGEIVSGASTITQQLARMLLLPDERYEQSYARKAREIILAAEIERRYSKEEILELYLNEIFYGNLSYGVEAAAETYFGTTAEELELWQASFLAGLPQSSVYDIFTNREATLARNRDVLVLMYELSQEENCIYVSTHVEPVCVDAVAATEAANLLESYEFVSPTYAMQYPHWVVYIQSLMEQQFDVQTIYRSGFTIYTTLDPDIQDQSEIFVKQQIEALAENNATNGAVVAIKPSTGEILALVGSADFYDEAISGQVNMALSDTRQPGSSVKPITFLAAFEKGWTPSTLIWDVPASFPPSGRADDFRDPYEPVNYDGKFHGPVSVRSALANSYNVPAVKALEYIGIYDDPATPSADGFIEMAKRLGITSLTRSDYGLSLTLGGGEVSLLEMTGAYSVFANSGRRIAPVAITKIVDYSGEIVYEYQAPSGDQVIRAEHAYLISSILSDTNARIPAFGTDPIINLPFVAAAKTGTTNDFRDNWTIGYTPDLVVGVWVGNADYTPMMNTSGLTGAAPIWANVMQYGIMQLTGNNPSAFSRPAGIIDRVICKISGTEPSQWCPEQSSEVFASDQLPLSREFDLWKEVIVDTWTGLLASNDCSEFTDEKFAINVLDNDGIRWLKESEAGKKWLQKYNFPDPIFFAPSRACRLDDSRPIIELNGITNGQTINISPLNIVGVIDATSNFREYRIDYGIGEKPSEWEILLNHEYNPVRSSSRIYEWDLSELPAGLITLRITVYSTNDTKAEKEFLFNIMIPTPTPTSTPTPTLTPTPTMTPTSTETPTEMPTQTPTEEPIEIPTEEPTQMPTDYPTPSPTPIEIIIPIPLPTEIPNP